MKIVIARPPMYDEIDAVFHVGDQPIIFTWGDTIYNPTDSEISPELKCHEAVHYQRQTNEESGIRAWWAQYLIDPAFRLAEELPAHKAEYNCFKNRHKDRNERNWFLHQVAERLSSHLYGGLIGNTAARRAILN
jgi:hypothetical protein